MIINFNSDQQYNQLQTISMFLLKRITCLITQNSHKVWSQAQPIFKDYYSRRLTLSPPELQQFFFRLSSKQFSESDHRWASLLQNIQVNLHKFQLHSRVYMLKALTGMSSRAELIEKLFQNISLEVKSLTFEEAAIYLWCVSKCAGPNKMQDVTKIYEHLCKILAEHQDEGEVRIVISKKENKKFEKKTLALKSTSICMILSSMAKLGITQKTILKHLLKSGVKPNVAAFSCNGLVTLLIALQKLGFRNKRDSLNIYMQLRKRNKELELGPIETIQNLAHVISNLANSKHFDEMQIDGRQKTVQTVQKLRQIRQGMTKFLLWLCQTIQLRQKTLSKQMATKILHYCGKLHAFNVGIWSKSLTTLCSNIEDCKIIDLVMTLSALSRLEDHQRKQFIKQEEQLSQRLWALHSSITGKSLEALAYLHQAKKINPPVRIADILNAHLVKKRARSQKTEKEQGVRQKL